MKYQKTVEILKEIIDRFGIEIYSDKGRLWGCVDDLTARDFDEQDVKNVLRTAVFLDIPAIIVKSRRNLENKTAALNKAYMEMEKGGLSKAWCVTMLYCLASPLGITTTDIYSLESEEQSASSEDSQNDTSFNQSVFHKIAVPVLSGICVLFLGLLISKQSAIDSTLSDNTEYASKYASLRNRYDDLDLSYTSLQSDYDDLDSKYTNLQTEYTDLQSDYEESESQRTDIQSKYDGIYDEWEFYHRLAVIVMETDDFQDVDGLYHNYNCQYHTEWLATDADNHYFRIYNIRAAEYYGYKPCSACQGED